MGALVGGLYAANCLEPFRQWAVAQRSVDVLRLLDLSFDAVGLIRGDKVFGMLRRIVGKQRIEELPIPFTAVATDLTRLKEIWFQEGDLLDAIRASISIPSLFTPVIHNGRVLVDGGLLNPIPIAPTVSAHADLIVAVNLNSIDEVSPFSPDMLGPFVAASPTSSRAVATAAAEDDVVESPALLDSWSLSSLGASIKRKLDKSSGEDGVRRKQSRLGRMEVIYQSVEAMQATLTQYKIAGYPPDVLIRVSKNSCRFYEFYRAAELIAVGRAAAKKALDELERVHFPGS